MSIKQVLSENKIHMRAVSNYVHSHSDCNYIVIHNGLLTLVNTIDEVDTSKFEMDIVMQIERDLHVFFGTIVTAFKLTLIRSKNTATGDSEVFVHTGVAHAL